MTLLVVFLLGCIVLILPFIPTALEVLNKTDLDPLKISNQTLKDPRSGPDFLFWHLANLLSLDNLDDLKKKAQVKEPTYLNPTLLAIPGGKTPVIPENVARVVSSDSIELVADTSYLSKFLSMSSITSGTNNKLNELHAQDRLTIDSGSKIVWWASGNEVELKSKVSAPGRIQAKSDLILNQEVYFHLLDSPSIRTKGTLRELTSDLPIENTKLRQLIATDHEIAPNEVIHGDLVVKGNLKVGSGAKIMGSIKCHHQIVFEKNATIFGNVVAQGDIEFKGNNQISGSVLGAKKITFHPGCTVGSLRNRVTCSSNLIDIYGEFHAHGTLRAWKAGRTLSSIESQANI